MTQVQAIQMNIHSAKVELSKSRRVVCKDDLQKIHVQGTIDFYINQLKDLKFCLSCAIKQESY